MRKKFIAGNWKMNKTPSEAVVLASDIVKSCKQNSSVEIAVCPPYTALIPVNTIVRDSAIGLGAQDMHWESSGAYTGKICGEMLKDAGADYVILGHSEQRTLFNESDEDVNRKVSRALELQLQPIICIGETAEEYGGGLTQSVVKRQLERALAGISASDVTRTIIAYEPVWAIGTGNNATPEIAQSVHAFIRGLLSQLYKSDLADGIRIIYGGSMKPGNAAELMSQPDVDGGLIGGASLEADSFAAIVESAL